MRVLIAGAGLAGLSAANDLARHGADVRVVDARPRAGGRVWTVRDAGGVHVEAGAEFIDAAHAEIRRLAAALHVPLVRVLRGGFGSALRVGRRTLVRGSQAEAWETLRHALGPLLKAYGRAGPSWDTAAAAAIASRSVASVFDARRTSAGARAMLEALRGFYAAEPDDLSALVLLDQAAAGETPGRAPMFRIRGGNDRLVDALARRLGGRLEPGRVVRSIRQHRRGIRATLEDARGRRHEVAADYAIVTLPPPLVLACAFDPPLPAAQAAALAALPLGAATKVSMRFTRPWWRRRGRPRAFGTNLPCGAVWESAEDQRAAVLTCLGGASASARLARAARGPAALARELAFLGSPEAGTLIGAPVSWEHDPWSRGAYAVFTPAFDPRDRRLLARAHGRVAFAGEHTSERWQGFMNGAVESGQRAAAEIFALEAVEDATT
jgi:monoamine oxidase